jgi:hypothetical protein
MDLFKDTHLVKLELLSNPTTIDSALHYIRSKQQQQQQQQQEKHMGLDSTDDGDSDNTDDSDVDNQMTKEGRQTVF